MTAGGAIAALTFLFINRYSENCYYFAGTTPEIGTRCPLAGFHYKALWVAAIVLFLDGLFVYFKSIKKDSSDGGERDLSSASPSASNEHLDTAAPVRDLVAEAAMEKYGIVADWRGYLVGERGFATLAEAVDFASSAKSEPG